jgi:hypothetical protein
MKNLFFKTPKPRQFSFPARYYDEEKDRLEQRRRELGLSGPDDKNDFRNQLSSGWKKVRNEAQKEQKRSSINVIIYILIIGILFYFIFFM